MSESPLLARALEEGAAAYPEVDRERPSLRSRLASHLEGAGEGACLPDLYLACACLEGDPGAVAVLARDVVGPAALVAARACRIPARAEDLAQALSEQLLVAARGGAAGLASYRGQGNLKAWVRVIAVREAVRWRRESERLPSGDSGLSALAASATASLPRLDGALLGSVLAQASSVLDAEERRLLRYHFGEGLSFEALAKLHATHRSTISRRVARARGKLREEVRRLLVQAHHLPDADVSTFIRSARRQLDQSVLSLLQR